jgi:hypothetical protein
MRIDWLGIPFGAILTLILSSCDVYDYDYKQVSLSRGDAYRGYELTRVQADGVRLRRQSSGNNASAFYSTVGRSHMGGSHSLGNNESVRVISLDPAAQQAELRFGWLDWVGPFTLPP